MEALHSTKKRKEKTKKQTEIVYKKIKYSPEVYSILAKPRHWRISQDPTRNEYGNVVNIKFCMVSVSIYQVSDKERTLRKLVGPIFDKKVASGICTIQES